MIADDEDFLGEEDDFDPYAEDVKPSVPLEQLMRKRPQASPADAYDVAGLGLDDDIAADESFTSPAPARAADLYARRRDNLEDQLRAKPKPVAPTDGVSLDFSGTADQLPFAKYRAPVDTGAGIPDAELAGTTSEVRAKQGVSSQDHVANYNDFVKLNPEQFDAIQDGIDPKDPAAVSQFNQAQFWARVQTVPGGIERFNKLPAPTKTAMLRKFSEDRMREIFPGYGRGQKLPPQAKEMARSIYNDMRAATALELNGVPRARQNTILGDDADTTIANVLKAPEIDRTFMDELEPKARSKYLSAFINKTAGGNRKLAADLRFQLAPLLLDEGGENYDKHIARVFPKAKDAPPPSADPNQGWVASTLSAARTLSDVGAYIIGEAVKTPGYIAGGVGAVDRLVTGDKFTDEAGKPIQADEKLTDFANWWTEGVNSGRDALTSQKSIDRREDVGRQQGKIVDEAAKAGLKAAPGAIYDFVKVMAQNPLTSVEQIAGMVANAFTGGAAGNVAAKGVAKAAGATATPTAKLLATAGSSAANTAGQVQNEIFGQLHPDKVKNSVAYELARSKYAKGELSRSRKEEARAGGYDYDLSEDFERWARDASASGGTISGLLQLGFAMKGGSIEKLIAGEAAKGAAKKGVAQQAGQTAVVEGLTEALQEYSAGVSTAYYERVRDEYDKTGDDDKMLSALADGRAAVQAGIGMILGGAVGGGFGALHALHTRGPDAAAEIVKETDVEPEAEADQSGPITPTVTPLDPATARAVASKYNTSVPASDGTLYTGSLESKLRANPAVKASEDNTAEQIATTREARDVERQLANADPAPVVPEATEAELIAQAENDTPTKAAEARLTAHVAERTAFEAELSRLKKNTTPAGIRRKAELRRLIKDNKDTTAPLQAEVDTLTKGDGRFTKVQVREADGTPTGVEMDRTEFDDLTSKQIETQVASAKHDERAKSLTAGLDVPAARIVELEKAKSALPEVMLAEQQKLRADAIAVSEDRVTRLQAKVDKEMAFLADLAKGKTAEQLISKDYKRAKTNAQKRLNDTKKKLDEAEEAFQKADNAPEPTVGRIRRSDEYKARQADYDKLIAEQRGASKIITEEAAKAKSAAQEVKDEFKAEEGFDADKVYTNRQAGLALTPITDTSLRRVVDRFADAVSGVGGVPIELVVVRSDADFTRAADQFGELPNKSFTTLARYDRAEDGTRRPTIYINPRRIEDAEWTSLTSELVSKAAAQFVVPHIARTEPRFKALLANISKTARKTAFGKRTEQAVADGFYANGVSPTQDAFHLSYVAELLRTAPRSIDANGRVTYGIERGLIRRAAAAINNYLLRRWPRVARGLGMSENIADIGKVNELFSKVVHTDELGHLPVDVDGDWTALFTGVELDRQKREFINTKRYVGALGTLMQSMRDRFAMSAAIDSSISKVSRGLVDPPAGVSQEQALARLYDVQDSVDLRVRRTDNRVRTEAEPLINEFNDTVRRVAASTGDSVPEFTKKFDTYVQLVSIQEMLTPGGDYYLSKVKLSKEARKAFDERFEQLIEDQLTVHNSEARAQLGREARADIDRIVAIDQAGKPTQVMSYAGFTLASVTAELDAYRTSTPALKAAFDETYPVLRRVIDRATEIDYESGLYDPLDIAFRNRKHFIYRGGQDIDASNTKELSDPAGRNIAGRKSIGGADETFSATGRKDLPKNSSTTALSELVHALHRAEVAKVAAKLEFVAEIDPKLLAKGETFEPETRSTPQAFTSSKNFDFNYVGAAAEGSTKSVQFIRDDGQRGKLTFAHEDVLAALNQHSVNGPYFKVMAQVQGLFGSLYTTRNPGFVVGVQAPRDLIHNTFTIIAPRHGMKAAAAYFPAVMKLSRAVTAYAAMDAGRREDYIAKLPATHPLRVYVEQGGWFGAHAQHSALDLAAQIKERGTIRNAFDAVGVAKFAGHLFDTLPEAADNLFRVAYVDIATRSETKNNLDQQTAVSRAGKIMDFSSGSAVQRAIAPWAPFGRAFTNGLYNLMFHDLWKGGQVPLKEVETVAGRKLQVDRTKVMQQFSPAAAGMILLASGAMYSLAMSFRGPKDEPPTADDLTGGLMIPGLGVKWPYQYGLNKIFGSIGALSAAVADGTITPEKAGVALANVLLKEATPLGLQYIPTSEHAHWFKSMVAQAFSTNALTKMVVPPAMNTDSFGRPIFGRNGAAKPSTPDAYAKPFGDGNADLTAYVSRQFGVISNVIDAAARNMSTNQTDDEKGRSVKKLTGLTSWAVGNRGIQEKIDGQEAELVGDYGDRLKAVKRTETKKDDAELRRSTPGGSSIEAYLKLDRKLGVEYSKARKKYAGQPDFSAKMDALNKKHQEQRMKALAKLREKRASRPSQ